MARFPRVVIPGLPHHLTQRGNRRQQTFFIDADYERYVDLMASHCAHDGVEVWAWCLMPNHGHMIGVPEAEDSLRRALGGAHAEYTREINKRQKWQGYLWQGRFASFVMDELHTINAARYIEMNPVRAGLVERPEEWPWSSARAHLAARDDRLVRVAPMLERVADWQTFLATGSRDYGNFMRRHSSTGRPLGSDEFLDKLEQRLGRPMRPLTRGRKPQLLSECPRISLLPEAA